MCLVVVVFFVLGERWSGLVWGWRLGRGWGCGLWVVGLEGVWEVILSWFWVCELGLVVDGCVGWVGFEGMV